MLLTCPFSFGPLWYLNGPFHILVAKVERIVRFGKSVREVLQLSGHFDSSQ